MKLYRNAILTPMDRVVQVAGSRCEFLHRSITYMRMAICSRKRLAGPVKSGVSPLSYCEIEQVPYSWA